MSATAGSAPSAAELTRFYRDHLPTVYGYLHRLCGGDVALAEDLTQDTWMQLARALRDGRPECADVRWLLTAARSRFIDHTRRTLRGERSLRLVASTAPDRSPEPTSSEVLDALDPLEPLHRLVLMLRYVEGLSVPEIADTIGRNVTATNSLLARARTELRARGRSTP